MKNTTKVLQRAMAYLVMLALVVTALLPANRAYAASKASLNTKSMIIGLGTNGPEMGNFYTKTSKYCISVNGAVKKATYSFTSSNKKVVTVKKIGTNAYLTGVKAGNATITCTQKLNGKSTKVGTVKVKVKKASVQIRNEYLNMGTVRDASYDSVCFISERNTSAKYTYTTNSANLTMSEEKVDESDSYAKGSWIYIQKYTAKAAGTYTVTVNETYNKKTTKIGSFKVTVTEPEIDESLSMDVDDNWYINNLISYPVNNSYDGYTLEGADVDLSSDDAVVSYDSDEKCLHVNKTGTAKVNVLYNGEVVATIAITAKDVVLEGIYLEIESEVYLDDEYAEIWVSKEPENAPGDYIFKSSDESIATVVNEDGEYYLKLLKAGTVTITATCGNFTESCEVEVIDEY